MGQESKQEKIARMRKEREEAAKAQMDAAKSKANNLNIETDSKDAMDELINVVEKEIVSPDNEIQEQAAEIVSIESTSNKQEGSSVQITQNQTPSTSLKTPEVRSGEYVKIKIQPPQKEETKSKRKQLLLKPSLSNKVEEVLKTQYPEVSFNDLVSQLLEGWLAEIGGL